MYKEIIRFKRRETLGWWLKERGITDDRDEFYLSGINDLSWSPDSTRIASAHNDFVVRVWNVKERNPDPIFHLIHQKFVVSVAWSPDGNRIASGDTKADPIRIWDANTGQQLAENYKHQAWPCSIDWSPDSKRLVSAGMDGRVFLWNTENWQTIGELQPDTQPLKNNFSCAVWNPTRNVVAFSAQTQAIFIWQAGLTNHFPISTQDQSAIGHCLAWSKIDSDKLACVLFNGKVSIWSLKTSDFIAHLPASQVNLTNGRSRCIDWSPDGNEIAASGGSGEVRWWKLGIPQPTFQADEYEVHALRWSPDGTMLATAGEEGTLRIWTRT